MASIEDLDIKVTDLKAHLDTLTTMLSNSPVEVATEELRVMISSVLDELTAAIHTMLNQAIENSRVGLLNNAPPAPEVTVAKLWQERQYLTQLQMEGYTKEEALIYYARLQNGEKPWLDGTMVNGVLQIPNPV
jgi:hypothetical protein